ncbi:hypothetical protein D9758_015620 [Tetrapyrgos nigripes]|uniref:Small nuclear ribonucleoprotein Prp3 C-terminal domain-containing protein n=1 Tax=Tetrapyrgos nigripes TaxID=182062 RepID=A0A8H5CKE8_9AGAR|nr:hypothetical protein D9758_015620 [Tetrapyrgos nigripes]
MANHTTQTTHPNLSRQLEELQLVKFSLLPGELLVFLEHCRGWEGLLEGYEGPESAGLELQSVHVMVVKEDGQGGVGGERDEIPPVTFQVSLDSWNVWFEVGFPTGYDASGSGSGFSSEEGEGGEGTNGYGKETKTKTTPTISVKGEDITRVEQEEWAQVVRERLGEIGETEYPIYQLLSLHLLPLLHEKAEAAEAAVSESIDSSTLDVEDASVEASRYDEHDIQTSSFSSSPSTRTHTTTPQLYHALLTSHHLISPKKRRSLSSWVSSSSMHPKLAGFAKIGYPGVIYVEGSKEEVEEFVDKVKRMQWLALRVRFLEGLDADTGSLEAPASSQKSTAHAKGKDKETTKNLNKTGTKTGKGNQNQKSQMVGRLEGWKELTKVGEVVDEMRRVGRERWVVEMGIGSGHGLGEGG